MSKRILSRACAAVLIVGVMFVGGCKNADTENTALQTEETDTKAQAETAGETQYPLG